MKISLYSTRKQLWSRLEVILTIPLGVNVYKWMLSSTPIEVEVEGGKDLSEILTPTLMTQIPSEAIQSLSLAFSIEPLQKRLSVCCCVACEARMTQRDHDSGGVVVGVVVVRGVTLLVSDL